MLAALLNRYPLAVFLTGTILNVVTVLIGTVIGVLLGSRMPVRIQQVLTDGLGLFVIVLGVSMGIRVLTDPAALPGDELAVLAAVLLGAAIGELLRLQDGLEGLGGWFQVGTDDDQPYQAIQQLEPLAHAAGIATCSVVMPGEGHTFVVWSDAFRQALPFFAKRLRLPPEPAVNPEPCRE